MFLFFALSCGFQSQVAPVATVKEKPAVLLDGTRLEVYWDDGDTFAAKDPNTGKKIKARLAGYNTLESYGPVHRWGEWTGAELYTLAKKAGTFASSQVWTCTDTKKGGGYGRILVDCPDLRKAILEAGLAHPFSVGEPAPAADLDAMRYAMKNQNGMWEKGAPTYLITSLHSQDEKPDKDAYNRICDFATGSCDKTPHKDVYATCSEICIQDSCMLYVPYKQRYGSNRADCLN